MTITDTTTEAEESRQQPQTSLSRNAPENSGLLAAMRREVVMSESDSEAEADQEGGFAF